MDEVLLPIGAPPPLLIPAPPELTVEVADEEGPAMGACPLLSEDLLLLFFPTVPPTAPPTTAAIITMARMMRPMMPFRVLYQGVACAGAGGVGVYSLPWPASRSVCDRAAGTAGAGVAFADRCCAGSSSRSAS